jgi:hypothetical protein
MSLNKKNTTYNKNFHIIQPSLNKQLVDPSMDQYLLYKKNIILDILENKNGFKKVNEIIDGFKYFIILKNSYDYLFIATAADLSYNFYFKNYSDNVNNSTFINIKNPITNEEKMGLSQFNKEKYIFAEYNPDYKVFNKYIN